MTDAPHPPTPAQPSASSMSMNDADDIQPPSETSGRM